MQNSNPSSSSVTAPDWFLWAVSQPTTSHFADNDGTTIHYRCWNAQDTHKPGLLFAHGYRGNSHWWDGIAPFFTENFRVVALDFSGMGESARRPEYGPTLFTQDLLTVIHDAGLAPAVLIGHSYGGGRVLRACADHPEIARHAIILDSYVSFADSDPPPEPRQIGHAHPYPDFATIMARYRLLPEQPAEAWAQDHVARHSIRQAEDGWRWKFDHRLPFAVFERDGAALLERITIPVDCVVGARSSVVSIERAQRIVRHLRQGRGPVVIPEAFHHLMLDQPLPLISTLRALLADSGKS